jgi:hypothetical protein
MGPSSRSRWRPVVFLALSAEQHLAAAIELGQSLLGYSQIRLGSPPICAGQTIDGLSMTVPVRFRSGYERL